MKASTSCVACTVEMTVHAIASSRQKPILKETCSIPDEHATQCEGSRWCCAVQSAVREHTLQWPHRSPDTYTVWNGLCSSLRGGIYRARCANSGKIRWIDWSDTHVPLFRTPNKCSMNNVQSLLVDCLHCGWLEHRCFRKIQKFWLSCSLSESFGKFDSEAILSLFLWNEWTSKCSRWLTVLDLMPVQTVSLNFRMRSTKNEHGKAMRRWLSSLNYQIHN